MSDWIKHDIVSPPPPASPVKMVPKIVPGVYGRVKVSWAADADGKIGICLEPSGVTVRLTAPELRDAARVLTALADAMEAGE